MSEQEGQSEQQIGESSNQRSILSSVDQDAQALTSPAVVPTSFPTPIDMASSLNKKLPWAENRSLTSAYPLSDLTKLCDSIDDLRMKLRERLARPNPEYSNRDVLFERRAARRLLDFYQQLDDAQRQGYTMGGQKVWARTPALQSTSAEKDRQESAENLQITEGEEEEGRRSRSHSSLLLPPCTVPNVVDLGAVHPSRATGKVKTKADDENKPTGVEEERGRRRNRSLSPSADLQVIDCSGVSPTLSLESPSVASLTSKDKEIVHSEVQRPPQAASSHHSGVPDLTVSEGVSNCMESISCKVDDLITKLEDLEEQVKVNDLGVETRIAGLENREVKIAAVLKGAIIGILCLGLILLVLFVVTFGSFEMA